jgi:hypothetical protein
MGSGNAEIDQMTTEEWRKLGFFYCQKAEANINEWQFYGSQQGLFKFVELLDKYIHNHNRHFNSEHDHYGPYMYLKIMTWDKPLITNNFIAGTINDLEKLKNIVKDKLAAAQSGQEFYIDKEYGVENTMGLRFIVLSADFDPPSLDK